ncbi:hypothetical protein HY621_01445 [Candidatus Uhrbacteria bacterium]|nr:hypothetical protein [Candidatus Uhrbacteria bacterium]
MLHRISHIVNRAIQIATGGVVVSALVLAGFGASAAGPLSDQLQNAKKALFGEGIAPQNIPTMVALIIQIFLGFLGINFVIQMIFAGVEWMNAGGDEKKTKSARDRILSSVIGILILVSAYVITNFVLTQLVGTATKEE